MTLHPARAFPRHTFAEGERVHYRPLQEVLAALEEGYLELECIEAELTRHYTIRQVGYKYRLSGATAGDSPTLLGEEDHLEDILEKHSVDLHAYRWYPHHSVAPEDHWILEATSFDPEEEGDALLDTSDLSERIESALDILSRRQKERVCEEIAN